MLCGQQGDCCSKELRVKEHKGNDINFFVGGVVQVPGHTLRRD